MSIDQILGFIPIGMIGVGMLLFVRNTHHNSYRLKKIFHLDLGFVLSLIDILIIGAGTYLLNKVESGIDPTQGMSLAIFIFIIGTIFFNIKESIKKQKAKEKEEKATPEDDLKEVK